MRVALYARVSTEEQAVHGLSIDAQLSALKEKYPHGVEYVELGVSARKPISKRPELQRLLRDVELGKYDLIAFTRLDRWTRNVREYYKCQDILDAHGVAWTAIQEDYETISSTGKFKVNIMLAIAQQEAEKTGERVKAVFDDKRRRGLVPTGKVPLGVKLVDGHYAPSDDAGKVRDIFNTYINVRSALETARQCEMTMQGVRYLISNKTYLDAGVIDQNTFDLAQGVRNARSQRRVRTDRVYLFSGLLVCPNCGKNLTSVFSNGSKYYRCARHYDGRCEGYSVAETKVEAYCLSRLMPTMKEYNLVLKKQKHKKVDISALKQKRDKLTDLYLENLITKQKYTDEFTRLSALITEAESVPKPIDTAEIKTVLKAYEGLSDAGKKAFWSRVLSKITPSTDGQNFTMFYTNGYITEDILTFVQDGLNVKAEKSKQ